MSKLIRYRMVLFLALPIAGGFSFASRASAQKSARPPMISEALTCGVFHGAGGIQAGNDLQRQNVDLTRFPKALCNDGSPGTFFFRPYDGEQNRNKWVIYLIGGGSCSNPDECAKRWCGVDTNFSAEQMTSNVAPATGAKASGILYRGTEFNNPLGDWNHVLVYYCTSDSWSGTNTDVRVTAFNPKTHQPIEYRINFAGRNIVEAVLESLRRHGTKGLSYTLAGGSTAMPDLDEAEEVVLAGASGGGAGVIANLDNVADNLRHYNKRVHGAKDNAPVVWGLIDSIFLPNLENLDYSTTVACITGGICNWHDYLNYGISNGSGKYWQPFQDESCLSWHKRYLRGSEWQCSDSSHIIRHHLTTPFFVRMGEGDELISKNLIEFMFSVPGYGLLDHFSFAALVAHDALALANIQTSAHEGSAMQTVPGVFVPSCDKHETIGNNESTFNVSIASSGTALTMFDVIANWRAGSQPSMLVKLPGGLDICAP